MKKITIANFWDYCLIFIQVFGAPVFETVQSVIAKCNPKLFSMISFTLCFIAITYFKNEH